jgi:hypothetical protein
MRAILLFVLGTFILTSVSCDSNLLSASAQKDTEAAIIFEADNLMNHHKWTEAITALSSLSATSLAKTDVKVKLASAYAGRCGMDFMRLTSAIEDFSSTSLLRVLLDFQKADPDFNDCKQSEDILQTIGDETVRDEDQNLLMAFSSLSKIGAILANDTTGADADDDGVADTNYKGCVLTNAQADEIMVAMSLTAKSLGQVTSVGGSVRTSMTTFCAGGPGVPAPCDNEETTDVDSNEEDAIRLAVHQSGQFGLNSNPGATCP